MHIEDEHNLSRATLPDEPLEEDKHNPVERPVVDVEGRVKPAPLLEETHMISKAVEIDETLVQGQGLSFSTKDMVTRPEDSLDLIEQREQEVEEDPISTSSFDARQYLMPQKESPGQQGDAVVIGNTEDNQVETVTVEESARVNDGKESIEEIRDQASEKRRNFEKLQEHIDTLTTEKMDLSLCLQQQTSIVQRLTQENENMVKRLNDAAIKEEKLSHLSKQYKLNEEDMQQEVNMLQKKLDSREKENRDLSSKVQILGSELILLEEKLLREKNERLKRDAIANKGGESESTLRQEIESCRRDNDMLQSTVAHLQEQLETTQKLLRKSDMERQDAIDTQMKLSHDLEAAMKQHNTTVPLPKSALLSADAMDSCADESKEKQTSIPPEIMALLPAQTWIPGMEDIKDDMNSVSERLYQILDIVDNKLGASSEHKADETAVYQS
jgi:DNA repair exonuclease SbcCD ATPase subunit